jgi:ketosteroid isomerase-like protein
MKTIKLLILICLAAIAALALAACAPPAANNANSNANANANAKPAAAAPTKDALVALDKKAWEAFKNKDGKFFESFLADNFVGLNPKGERMNKAAVVKEISEHKCETKSFSFSDEQMIPAGADAAILTYKATQDITCDGKKETENVWVASVFVRSGSEWKGAYHNEAPAIDPKPAAPKEAADNTAKAPPPPPAKSEKAPAADEKEKPAAPAEDPAVAVVRKGWEAWKNQDAKALEASITKDFVLVDATGQRSDHAGAMKVWTESKCEVKSFTLSDTASSSLAPDVSIVTLKGTADGTCGGMKLGSLWGSYLLVKEGDAWKAAMIFETPAK